MFLFIATYNCTSLQRVNTIGISDSSDINPYCFFLALSATFFLFALNVDLEEEAFFVVLEVFAFFPAPVDFAFVAFLPVLTLDLCDFAFGLFES